MWSMFRLYVISDPICYGAGSFDTSIPVITIYTGCSVHSNDSIISLVVLVMVTPDGHIGVSSC